MSKQALWHDRASNTIMLTPEQLNHQWLNGPAQLPYIIRFSQFQANPANVSSVHLFEANLSQNPNNPFIHHAPISPNFPGFFAGSPEQPPTLEAAPVESQAGNSGLVSTGPTAFPTAGATDLQTICWTVDPLPWNMPLFFRWWVAPSRVGHATLYDFWVGQFVLRCGPTDVEVFQDTSAHGDYSSWASVARLPLFSGVGPIPSTSFFSQIFNANATEVEGHLRSLLFLPYRRQYVYLESSYGGYGVFKATTSAQGNGLSGNQADWAIVQNRHLFVAGLTPGPGLFQIQKLKFADGPGKFNLEPFVLDYLPSVSPANSWLFDRRDTPQGSTCTHTTPATPAPYTFTYNTIDQCTAAITIPTDDQSRTFGSTYTLTPGTDPTNGSLKTYTPMLYSVEARVPNEVVIWPKTANSVQDKSIAAPSARVKRAEIHVELDTPGRFRADLEDLQESLAAYYFRSEFPLAFSDTNGNPGTPALWTTLWLGIADPVETRELRLDSNAPREMGAVGVDFWKWLNETPMRDTRDWTGFGHIYTIQAILQQAGISIAGWDGPAAGTVVSKSVNGQIQDVFVPDTAGLDDPLGGPPNDDPTTQGGAGGGTSADPVYSAWRPHIQPSDSYGSFIKRIAELWSGWNLGFHADGTPYYHRWDYYTASEATFHKDQTSGDPHYFHASVHYEPLYPDANAVALAAATFSGSVISSSVWIDAASIQNGSAVNFIGKEKALFTAIPGVLSCDSLNKAARAVFERARRRRLRVHFSGTYVPTLKVGHCFTLEGISGVWRLQSFSARYERPSWNVAEMEGELVEAGHS